MVYSYSLFNLGICSEIPFPQLITADLSPDVYIHVGHVEPLRSGLIIKNSDYRVDGDEIYFKLKRVGAFLVRGGREIIVDPLPRVDQQLLILKILNSAVALVLHQRGKLVLHASTVAIKDAAVVITGGSGVGKTTLATILVRRGARAVTDDITAIETDKKGELVALPGIPWLKVPEQTARALDFNPEIMSPLYAGSKKYVYRPPSGFTDTPLRLKAVYVMDRSMPLGMEDVPPQEALKELVRNTYTHGFVPALGPSAHLKYCATLINTIGIRRIGSNDSFEDAFHLADLVERDVQKN